MSARDLDLSRDLLPVATADLHVPCDDTPLFAAAAGWGGHDRVPLADAAAAALPAHYPPRGARPAPWAGPAAPSRRTRRRGPPPLAGAWRNRTPPSRRARPSLGEGERRRRDLADVATCLERLEAPSSSASDVRESASPLTPPSAVRLAAFGDGAELLWGGAFAFSPPPPVPAAGRGAREGGSRGREVGAQETLELGTLRALGSPLSSYSPRSAPSSEGARREDPLPRGEGRLTGGDGLEERRERARLRAASVSPYDPKTPPAVHHPDGANFPAMTDDRTPSTDNSGVVALAMLTPTTNASSVASLPGGTPTDDAGTTPDATCALARALANRRRARR